MVREIVEEIVKGVFGMPPEGYVSDSRFRVFVKEMAARGFRLLCHLLTESGLQAAFYAKGRSAVVFVYVRQFLDYGVLVVPVNKIGKLVKMAEWGEEVV